MIPKIVMDVFIEMHSKDSSDAKFKIGDKARYIPGHCSSDSREACQDHCQYDAGHNCRMCDRFKETLYYKNSSIHTILAVNVQEPGVVEYAISDYGFLVYEEELKEKIE